MSPAYRALLDSGYIPGEFNTAAPTLNALSVLTPKEEFSPQRDRFGLERTTISTGSPEGQRREDMFVRVQVSADGNSSVDSVEVTSTGGVKVDSSGGL